MRASVIAKVVPATEYEMPPFIKGHIAVDGNAVAEGLQAEPQAEPNAALGAADSSCEGSSSMMLRISIPIQSESIINRLAIEVNGQTLVNLTNYNVLFHALLYMSATDDYQLQRKAAQCNTQTGAAGGSCQRIPEPAWR
jgi:hypothetical protein